MTGPLDEGLREAVALADDLGDLLAERHGDGATETVTARYLARFLVGLLTVGDDKPRIPRERVPAVANDLPDAF